MKKYLSVAMAAIVLAGCAENRADKPHEKAAAARHWMKSGFAFHDKAYEYHDPDCPLCREQRKLEVIAIVDSMLREE